MNATQVDERYLTPPEVARLWRVNLAKVMGFIESGELPAINLAIDAKGERPRYKIRMSDLALFEVGRMTQQAVVKRQRQPRTRRDTDRVQRYEE